MVSFLTKQRALDASGVKIIYIKKNAFSVLGNMENSGSNCLITIDLSGSHHLTAQDFSETNWLITPNTQ